MTDARIVVDRFISEATCAALIAHHQRHGRVSMTSENTLDHRGCPEAVAIIPTIYKLLPGDVVLDCAFLCAIHSGGFHHSRHADNCRIVDGAVVPNHTPWRKLTALLYLNEVVGGLLIFESPEREIVPMPGRLVISPSDHLHFHHTTPVREGVRYSLNCWFK